MGTQLQEPHAETRRAGVTINFGGEVKRFDYRPHLTVTQLRDEAIRVFGITANPHLLGLFDDEDHELQDALTLNDAGVRPGDRLILRPSAVRAG